VGGSKLLVIGLARAMDAPMVRQLYVTGEGEKNRARRAIVEVCGGPGVLSIPSKHVPRARADEEHRGIPPTLTGVGSEKRGNGEGWALLGSKQTCCSGRASGKASKEVGDTCTKGE